MKDSNTILQFVSQRIGQIYERPRMYAASPACLDTILHYDHELWAEILERGEEFRSVRDSRQAEEGCVARSFATKYQEANAGATDQDVSRYVVLQWQMTDDRLGLTAPR